MNVYLLTLLCAELLVVLLLQLLVVQKGRRDVRASDEKIEKLSNQIDEATRARSDAEQRMAELREQLADSDGAREEIAGGARQLSELLERATRQLQATEQRVKRQFAAIERMEAQRDVANENYHKAVLGMSAAQSMMVTRIAVLGRRLQSIKTLGEDAGAKLARGETPLAVHALAGIIEAAERAVGVEEMRKVRDDYVARHEQSSSKNHTDERVNALLHERRNFGLDAASDDDRTPAEGTAAPVTERRVAD